MEGDGESTFSGFAENLASRVYRKNDMSIPESSVSAGFVLCQATLQSLSLDVDRPIARLAGRSF